MEDEDERPSPVDETFDEPAPYCLRADEYVFGYSLLPRMAANEGVNNVREWKA